MGARLARLQRRSQVVELLLLGATVAEIAQVFSITREQARREIAACERLEDMATRQMVGRYRQLQFDRLEDLVAAMWRDARAGDPKAVREIRACLARQSKLLGLDAPERREVELSGQVDLGLRQLPPEKRAELRAQLLKVADGEDVVEAEVTHLIESGGGAD